MTVYVPSLGREGTVRRVRGSKVDVQVGGIRFTSAREELRVAAGGSPGRPLSPRQVVRAQAHTVPREGTANELRLIGMTADEARDRLDRFLDSAAVVGYGEVRVIHGHGTGRLRRAVREFLDGHPHVERHRPGKAHEGGDGATVVTLR
jgi:DNA mismatch repair protein MutS2